MHISIPQLFPRTHFAAETPPHKAVQWNLFIIGDALNKILLGFGYLAQSRSDPFSWHLVFLATRLRENFWPGHWITSVLPRRRAFHDGLWDYKKKDLFWCRHGKQILVISMWSSEMADSADKVQICPGSSPDSWGPSSAHLTFLEEEESWRWKRRFWEMGKVQTLVPQLLYLPICLGISFKKPQAWLLFLGCFSCMEYLI